jgi:sugar phosphate isomerase/epimerase
MHINDNDLENDLHDAIGSGQIDWNCFSEEMQRHKINASVLVEVSGEEKQRKSLEYLEKQHIYLLK